MSLMSDERVPPRGRLRGLAAEEIRVLLARKRMSAAELARRTGIKQSTMARRMTGETAFDLDDLEAIAVVLEVEVTDLLPKPALLTELRSESAKPADRHVVRPITHRPIMTGRHDSSRPSSPIADRHRRPVSTRPPARPLAV
jgi:transcriptional regulator with XRE-family HTH domain